MLLKPFTAYIAGVATVALAHSLGSGVPGTLGFALGTLTTLLVLIWALSTRKRLLWAGKFLIRLSGPTQQEIKQAAALVNSGEKPKNPRKGEESPIYFQTVIALKSLGANKETARWAAGQATMRLPDASFEETFKFAVKAATGREAA